MYFHLKNYFCVILKKIIMKGTKGSETKALIRETAIQTVSDKELQHGTP